MSQTALGARTPPGPSSDRPRVRRAYRPADHRVVGGVAMGLAQHLDVPVLWVRVGFVVTTWFNGVGVLAYLLLWRFMPLRRPELSPGLESASRRGMRAAGRPGVLEIVQTVAVLAVGVGVLFLVQGGGRLTGSLLIPLLIVVVGVAVVWRQIDDAAWQTWLTRTTGWGFVARIAVGLGLVALGAVYLVTQERGLSAVRDLGSALAIAVVGLLLLLGPWIISLVTALGSERRERIRTQERADVAAHLHDSVLQTLALLQKNADDPAAVATLARRQERELRSWLYGDEESPGDSLAAALREVRSEVEQTHQLVVELVVVGDTALDADLVALVRATREAVVNAAKHAGVDRVDVYAEVGSTQVEVFVRDRGTGFDPDLIADDRMGVRGSIVGRMERHGGTARVRSTPGEGTEVALTLTRRAAPVAGETSPVRPDPARPEAEEAP
ncbi:ATP-binding protein [Aeromicrobium sp. 50.2.37]|uniref:ATP-binding protein n=1 Tax=Aeromicrobium sp. 50.2.37 TaxID=2969305 RepID=UPI00215060CB|nr:ATP-binding protein [Aeromicrobium sp. 50.2.37]MCR4513583.1 PspC domain-containing protein [Aeromicrobium sp. 50.2.37]